jgi:hypothetical protein
MDCRSQSIFQTCQERYREAPVLESPNYTKEFSIISFSSEHIVAAILFQKNEEGFEHRIAFFNKSLKEVELRYDILEKQAYAMVKALKDFITYVVHSNIIAYMPTNVIKDISVQPDNNGRRGRWLAKIQEFDLEVRLTKLVKGQGLARLLTESNFRVLRINNLKSHDFLLDIDEIDDQIPMIYIEDKFSSSTWYRDIVSYLLTLQCQNNMTPSKERTLKLHTIKYYIFDGKLY